MQVCTITKEAGGKVGKWNHILKSMCAMLRQKNISESTDEDCTWKLKSSRRESQKTGWR